MNHFTASNLVIIVLFAITSIPSAASAQEEIAGIIETHGFAVGGLDYLAGTTDELADELAGIIETNGTITPEELADFDETLGYVLDDLAREAEEIAIMAMGTGAIGLEGDAAEIAVMALGTGAIGLEDDAGSVSIHGGEWVGSSFAPRDVLFAVANVDLPEGDAAATLRTARQLTSFLEQAAHALRTM
jgi:hypothetical protein